MSQHNRGSSHQLLQWTKQPHKKLAKSLEQIINLPFAKISSECIWRPDGENDSKEYNLVNFFKKVCKYKRGGFNNWWVGKGTNPTFDFLSTCRIKCKKGMVLVEAKSHINEMETCGKLITVDKKKYTVEEFKVLMREKIKSNKINDKSFNSIVKKLINHDKIGQAIAEARGALSNYLPEIKIDRDNHYQLSNRIASAWKLAQCGMPTILLYLGFTDDPHWLQKDPINNDEHWRELMKEYLKQVGVEKLLKSRTITFKNKCSMSFCIGTISCNSLQHIGGKSDAKNS